MKKAFTIVLIFSIIYSCNTPKKEALTLDQEVLTSLGNKYKNEFGDLGKSFQQKINEDSTNITAYIGLIDAYILQFIFGYVPRDVAIGNAKSAFEQAYQLDSTHSDIMRLSGTLSFLDWEWEEARVAFRRSIKQNPKNLNARHWYSLWLSAMDRFDEAMAQSDTILMLDSAGDYIVGRSSLLYFQHRFDEMIPLLKKNIEKNPQAPWPYDWLGMAYNGIDQHEQSIETYFKAFELSDGTVEVGAGLGHALGEAGEAELAKEMADYYTTAAKNNYLPPVQRAFVHLGIEEYDQAMALLEKAHDEKSWFLIFIQIEPWYDPVREDPRFKEIITKMKFPE